MAPDATKDPRATRQQRLNEVQRATNRRERLRLALIVGVPVAVIAVVVVAVLRLAPGDDTPQDPDQPKTAGDADLSAVQKYDDLTSDHVITPVTYEQSPPVGGAHNPLWLNCGVYTDEVPNENAVHSMEHGAVWITYHPDLDPAEVEELTSITPATFAVLSPHSEQQSPIVLSAWGRQLAVESSDDPRITAFITQYRLGGIAPEPGASCDGASDGTLPLDAAG